MIIVVAGPSGSGKTSFIKKLFAYKTNLRIIEVDVLSSHRFYDDIGRRQIAKTEFEFNELAQRYTATFVFENSKYGYMLPQDVNDHIYVIDYPGEYPCCQELKGCVWKGVLVLPPSREILRERLSLCNRIYRISGAIKEYEECLTELKSGLYDDWFIVINDKIDSLSEAIHYLCAQFDE